MRKSVQGEICPAAVIVSAVPTFHIPFVMHRPAAPGKLFLCFYSKCSRIGIVRGLFDAEIAFDVSLKPAVDEERAVVCKRIALLNDHSLAGGNDERTRFFLNDEIGLHVYIVIFFESRLQFFQRADDDISRFGRAERLRQKDDVGNGFLVILITNSESPLSRNRRIEAFHRHGGIVSRNDLYHSVFDDGKTKLA